MPGYAIHLAVAKIYIQNNKIKDIQEFERGIITPDFEKDKSKSHYGPNSSNPGLNKFLIEQGISSEFNEGYFLHLATDFLFYKRFLKKCDSSIYEEYDKLNRKIISKYKIIIPKEIENVVKFKEGNTVLIKEKEIYNFIDTLGKINFREMIKQGEKNIEAKLLEIKF